MLVLGSSSPRRLEILKQVGMRPDEVIAPNVDESIQKNEKPEKYVKRIALEKNLSIDRSKQDYILSADTIVVLGTKVLGKPVNIDQAKNHIERLSGRRHRVFSTVVVSHMGITRFKTVSTIVKFKQVSHEELNFYLSYDDWKGKAGGYAIQGLAARFVKQINGSYSNVMGLPVLETVNLLSGLGYKVF